MSSPPPNLDVKVTVDSSGITADPDALQVPNRFDGTITWTLSGGEFIDSAITFEEAKLPGAENGDRNTPTTRVWSWSNFLEKGDERVTYHYTLHAAPAGGGRLEHDPAVENEPPNG